MNKTQQQLRSLLIVFGVWHKDYVRSRTDEAVSKWMNTHEGERMIDIAENNIEGAGFIKGLIVGVIVSTGICGFILAFYLWTH